MRGDDTGPTHDTRNEVYWVDDDAHYAGRVSAYDERTRRHTVVFDTVVFDTVVFDTVVFDTRMCDDGDTKVMELAKEKWRLEATGARIHPRPTLGVRRADAPPHGVV